MMAKEEGKESTAAGMALGGIGGALLGTIAAILLTKPAKAAPSDEKLDYLIECQTAIVQLLGQIAEANQAMVGLLQQFLAVAPEGVEVKVFTRWQAKDPEEIFNQAILSTGTLYSDKMVSWAGGKRLVVKVESTLNQAVNIQVIGNTTDSKDLATDINDPLPCPADSNISIGPAWDDWHPYIGVKVSVAVAPTAGVLRISTVIQG